MPRTVTALVSVCLLAAAAIVAPSLSTAVSGTGAYGAWATSGGSGTLTFTGADVPNATFTSERATLTVATSATLTGTSSFGAQYGTSRGRTYLSSAIAGGQPSGTTTLTFAIPPAPGTWGMAFGDIDAENVVITATDMRDQPVDVSQWYIESFNYANDPDLPTWDGATATLNGNVNDTNGASAWFTPTEPVKTITLKQVRSSGFPQYQLWIAADLSSPTPTAVTTATAIPNARDGKVVLCHATSSAGNPYVRVEVSEESVTGHNGHGSHIGGVFPAAGWGDIIPPFTGFDGLNWRGGDTILANGCRVGAMLTPTPTPTVSASPSASAVATPQPVESSTLTPTASEAPTQTPSPTSTPTPSATPNAPIAVDPTDPGPVVVPPDGPTSIDVGGGTVTEVLPPDHGTVDVNDGTITYTPDPGFFGRDQLMAVVTNPQGATSRVVITLNVGRVQTAPVILPDHLAVGGNRLMPAPVLTNARQAASVSVKCSQLTRSVPSGDVVWCEQSTSGGSRYLRISAVGPLRVTVTLSAPAAHGYGQYSLSRTYLVR